MTTQNNLPSRIGFFCALSCLPAKWWIFNEIFYTVYLFLSTNDWLALPLPPFLPSFLIVLMHLALSGSMRKSIFLADFRKSTIPSEPIIKLNITWGRQKRKKMKAVNKRRHAVSIYPFPLWKWWIKSASIKCSPCVLGLTQISKYFSSSFTKIWHG